MITLLGNDHTYELAERYQDHACFEALNELRAHKRALAYPVWAKNPRRDEEIAREITAAEQEANEARARWGSEIAEQYGWARPALAGGDRWKRRIFFSDLEKAAGADFRRGLYVAENGYVHAGSYAAINHFELNELNTRGRMDEAIRAAGWWTVNFLDFASHITSKAVAWETEEYDELLYACEMTRAADTAKREFIEDNSNCSPSS
jgi:hypothetical protein